jgi:hypothetical protein
MAAWLNPKADLLPSDGLLPPMVPMLPCVAPRLPPGTVPPGYRLLDSLGPAPGRFLSSSVGAYISALGLFIFFVMMAEAFLHKRASAANPWGEGATTLEWTLSPPPPFHQFDERSSYPVSTPKSLKHWSSRHDWFVKLSYLKLLVRIACVSSAAGREARASAGCTKIAQEVCSSGVCEGSASLVSRIARLAGPVQADCVGKLCLPATECLHISGVRTRDEHPFHQRPKETFGILWLILGATVASNTGRPHQWDRVSVGNNCARDDLLTTR